MARHRTGGVFFSKNQYSILPITKSPPIQFWTVAILFDQEVILTFSTVCLQHLAQLFLNRFTVLYFSILIAFHLGRRKLWVEQEVFENNG